MGLIELEDGLIPMKISDLEELYEMLMTIPPVDFNMDDRDHNRTFAQSILSRDDRQVIEETSEYTLYRVGDHDKGNFAMIDKKRELVIYWVQYRSIERVLTGKTVTQVALWRDPTSIPARKFAEKVIFDYLLKEWPAVMSDSSQTDKGERFWKMTMAIAADTGYRIGAADFNDQTISWYDPRDSDPAEWISDQDAWGDHEKHMAVRFIIANP